MIGSVHPEVSLELLRARREVRKTLRMNFARGTDEPLVWLPDIVAGAVSAARGDGDQQYLTPLEAMLTEYTIYLD